MFHPDTNDPYRQQSLPYQPYATQTTPTISQRNEAASSLPRAVSSYNTHARSMQARPVTPRKSKAEALAFVHKCKRWLVAGSVVAFGVLGGLAAGHAIGTTSNHATPASNAPATSPSPDGGFFQQQQEQQQQGGGYGFGNSNPWQPPVSGSHTS